MRLIEDQPKSPDYQESQRRVEGIVGMALDVGDILYCLLT